MGSAIEKEKKVIKTMITLYCRKKHKAPVLCQDCEKLLNYAHKKLDVCPLKDNKPSCKNCHIHCYNEEMRKKIKEVMKFSGPRMLLYHPLEWIKHKI